MLEVCTGGDEFESDLGYFFCPLFSNFVFMPSTFFLPSARSLSLSRYKRNDDGSDQRWRTRPSDFSSLPPASSFPPIAICSRKFQLDFYYTIYQSFASSSSSSFCIAICNRKHKFDFFYCTIIFVVFFGLLLLQIPSFFRLLLLSVSRSVAGNTRLLLLDSFYRAILLLLQTSFFFFFCTLLSSSSSSSADFFLFLLYHGHVPSQNA